MSAQAQFIVQSYEFFFETCAVDNKDNKGRRLELGDFTERIGNVYLMKDNKRPGKRVSLVGALGEITS